MSDARNAATGDTHDPFKDPNYVVLIEMSQAVERLAAKADFNDKQREVFDFWVDRLLSHVESRDWGVAVGSAFVVGLIGGETDAWRGIDPELRRFRRSLEEIGKKVQRGNPTGRPKTPREEDEQFVARIDKKVEEAKQLGRASKTEVLRRLGVRDKYYSAKKRLKK